jgi:hypothetical protein
MAESLDEWLTRAQEAWQPVEGAENKFFAVAASSMDASSAACDELSAAALDFRRWMDANPCSAPAHSDHWRAMVADYEGIAAAIREGSTEPCSSDEVIAVSVELLLADLKVHADAIREWLIS